MLITRDPDATVGGAVGIDIVTTDNIFFADAAAFVSGFSYPLKKGEVIFIAPTSANNKVNLVLQSAN